MDPPSAVKSSSKTSKSIAPSGKQVDEPKVNGRSGNRTVSSIEEENDIHGVARVGLKRKHENASATSSSNARKSSKAAKRNGDTEGGEDDDWDESLHKLFVASIYEIGLRNSSPAVILENMAQKPKSITSERVKSKLQKYRNNREKSKQEFMEEYDSFLQRAKAIECAGGTTTGAASVDSPEHLLEMMGSSKLFGGDSAAFLTYAVMKERESIKNGDTEGTILSTHVLRKGAMDYVENFAGVGIPFPELTSEEKKSSLGVSMTFVMGLFLSMTEHLMSERATLKDRLENSNKSQQQQPPQQQQIHPTSGEQTRSLKLETNGDVHHHAA